LINLDDFGKENYLDTVIQKGRGKKINHLMRYTFSGISSLSPRTRAKFRAWPLKLVLALLGIDVITNFALIKYR
jgi:hypothetical protein